MALRPLTDPELRRVVHASSGVAFVFKHAADDPQFLQETIEWKVILSRPSVTKTFLLTNVLVAAALVVKGSQPFLGRKAFFKHLDDTEEETVKAFKDFLEPRLIVKESAT